MSIAAKTYFAKGSVTVDGLTVTMNDVQILAGAANDTIVRSLTIINNAAADSVVYIKRADTFGSVYFSIKVFLPPGQSRVLWDDFIVIPEGHKLIMASDSDDTEVVVSCFEGVSVYPAPNTKGILTVSITGASGQWSVDNGSTWNDSGDEIILEADDYSVKFKAVEGYVTPANQSATITAGETTTIYGSYTEAIEADETALTVTIYGASGQWSIDGGINWNNSGITLSPSAGDYTITFSTVEGYTAPLNISVTVSLGIAVSKAASYTVAITPGTAMLYLIGDTDTLVADDVNLDDSGGITNNFGFNVVLVNGAMVAAMPGDIRELDFGNNWVDVSGITNVDGNDVFVAVGLATNTSGELYVFKVQAEVSTLTKLGVATDWVSVDGNLFATNSSGSFYIVTGDTPETYALVKIGDNLTALSYGSFTVCALVLSSTDVLSFVQSDNTLRQISTGLTYTIASGGFIGYNPGMGIGWMFDPDAVYTISSVTYLIGEDGKLYALYNNSEYRKLSITWSFSIRQIGVATNWVNVVGYSSKQNNTTDLAWALNSDGNLYALENTTLILIGTGFTGAKMTTDYILKTDGTLYKRNGTSSPILLDDYDDWIDLWGSNFAVRQPEV